MESQAQANLHLKEKSRYLVKGNKVFLFYLMNRFLEPCIDSLESEKKNYIVKLLSRQKLGPSFPVLVVKVLGDRMFV